MSKTDKGRLPPFVPLLKETLATAAWRATSHGARSLYVALKLRYSSNFKNNGKIFLSSRAAAIELGSHRDSIMRWFRELEYYGFIVMTNPGALGVDGKGKAPHWRLTELGYMNDPPTKDFLHWNRVPFEDSEKQNPGPKSRATPALKAGPPLVLKVGPPLVLKVGPLPDQGGPESRAISGLAAGPKSGAISRLTILPAEKKAQRQLKDVPTTEAADVAEREAA